MELKISNNLRKQNNKEISGQNWFSKPGNLVNDNKKDVSLEEKAKYFAKDMTIEEMREYAKKHTSGVRLDTSLCSAGGGRIATFEKFVEMVQDGYNIVKADVINYDMIDVEFQLEFSKDKRINGGMGGR